MLGMLAIGFALMMLIDLALEKHSEKNNYDYTNNTFLLVLAWLLITVIQALTFYALVI